PRADRYLSAGEASAPAPERDAEPGQTIALGESTSPRWWQLFQSPEMDGLLQQVVGGNLTLQAAGARLAAERELLVATRAALYPQLAFTAQIAREKESSTAFGLPPSAFALPPNFTLLQAGPVASYNFDLFGASRSRLEQQRAVSEFQQFQLAATYLTLTGNAAAQAIAVASVRAQLQAVDDLLRVDQETLALVRKARDVGVIPESDVVSAESQLAVDATLRPPLEQQLDVCRHALAILVGRVPADWSAPDFDLSRLRLPQSLPVALPSQLVHQRPDILAAEAQLHAAGAQVGVATAQLFPQITLSASISGTSLNGSSLFDPAGLVWSIAAGLTQPLFDAGMRRAQRRAALAEFKASASDYQQTVLQAFAQVADDLQALSHDAWLLSKQKLALDTAAESVRLQRARYQIGGSGIIDLLDAQRQYAQASLGYVRAEAQRYADTIQLQIAMGGGTLAVAAPP
ncbi:MAG: efflux transporter outer membrane subunit, partial [Sinobacteraceae bacterium]|nr:efflux transporter outer membrane subunit [Nevskiaceae bacterium]